MAGESKTNVYMFDHYISQFVDGIDAGTHKHGVYLSKPGAKATLYDPALHS